MDWPNRPDMTRAWGGTGQLGTCRQKGSGDPYSINNIKLQRKKGLYWDGFGYREVRIWV